MPWMQACDYVECKCEKLTEKLMENKIVYICLFIALFALFITIFVVYGSQQQRRVPYHNDYSDEIVLDTIKAPDGTMIYCLHWDKCDHQKNGCQIECVK